MIIDLLLPDPLQMLSQLIILGLLFGLMLLTAWQKPLRPELTKRDFGMLGFMPSHRHYKGGEYEEATRAVATDPIEEGEAVVVYVHSTGSTYARPARLFDQPWRFETVD